MHACIDVASRHCSSLLLHAHAHPVPCKIHAQAIEAKYTMRSGFEWDRFIRFMDRYAEAKGLGFEKGAKVSIQLGGGDLKPCILVPSVSCTCRIKHTCCALTIMCCCPLLMCPL